MAEGVIIVPPDSTGKSLRTVTNPGVAAGAHQEVVTLADSAGTELGTNANPVPVSDGGGSLTVDGTFWQATQPVSGTVTADTELEAVAALADATANPTSSRLGSMSFLFNGTTWDRMRGDITNGLDVDVTRLPALVAGSAVIGHVITDTGSTTAVTGTVTVDSELEAVAAFADATANPTATRLGAYLFGYNGTTWDRLRSTTANGLAVDVTRVTGTVTVAGTVTANDVPNYTEDAASAADPVMFVNGGVRRDTPLTTEVSADGDNIAAKYDKHGFAYVRTEKEVNRVQLAYSANRVAAPGATGVDALISLDRSADGAAISSATSNAVTSGKRLRIQSIMLSMLNGATLPVAPTAFTVRFGSGATTASSPVVLSYVPDLIASRPVTTLQLAVPDGFELSGSMTFGVSFIFTTNAPTNISVSILAYEYTA